MKYLVTYIYSYTELFINRKTDIGHCVIDYPHIVSSPEEFPDFLEHVRQKLGKEETPVILNVVRFPL